MRLIDFSIAYQSILQQLEDGAEIELTKELDAIKEDRDLKLEACGWAYRNLLAEATAFQMEGDRLLEKAQRLEMSADRLKEYISYCLAGESAKTKTFSFSFRKSEAVEVLDPELIPEQYQRVKTIVEPDKKLIKEDLKSGATIPGCALLQNQSLQIK